MTKENFVSLECAKLLEEMGFVDLCDHYYSLSEDELGTPEEMCFNTLDYPQSINETYSDRVAAPTLYKAQKWLRETHSINITVICKWRTGKYYYAMNIYQDGCNIDMKCKDDYPTYEEALNAGIIETLKMI